MALEVSRQAFYDYLDRKNNPWKYEQLSVEMQKIHNEDECNDCYGRKRMYMALKLKKEAVILQGIAGGRVHFTQCLCQLMTESHAFVRQVVK